MLVSLSTTLFAPVVSNTSISVHSLPPSLKLEARRNSRGAALESDCEIALPDVAKRMDSSHRVIVVPCRPGSVTLGRPGPKLEHPSNASVLVVIWARLVKKQFSMFNRAITYPSRTTTLHGSKRPGALPGQPIIFGSVDHFWRSKPSHSNSSDSSGINEYPGISGGGLVLLAEEAMMKSKKQPPHQPDHQKPKQYLAYQTDDQKARVITQLKRNGRFPGKAHLTTG